MQSYNSDSSHPTTILSNSNPYSVAAFPLRILRRSASSTSLQPLARQHHLRALPLDLIEDGRQRLGHE
jgi:hypothetical protein